MRGARHGAMRWALAAWLASATAATAAPVAAPADTNRFPLIAILCYHDVSGDVSTPLQTVPAQFLREQIRACRAQGWSFLSLAELLAHREHPELLPRRVLVLMFDDGYRSFSEQALPILREEHVPATLGIITSFVEQPHPELPPMLTWADLRQLDAAGDVDVVSHSHALHQYETSDPQRDTGPSACTRRWLPDARRYEDREEYRGRIGGDLHESQRVLVTRLGHPVDVLVWPYGERNDMALAQAARAGFSASLTLDPRPVSAADLKSGCLPRVMVTRKLRFDDPRLEWLQPPPLPVRAAEVDLDSLWDPDETRFRARLDLAVTRARALGATDVILPFAPDGRGDGQLQRAFAMNHQLPLLADVWSMAAAKFAVAQMRVWVRAPSMNLSWTWERHPEWRVRRAEHSPLSARWSTRLSPDVPEARDAAEDLWSDLAVYLPIDGVLFDDDAALGSDERLAGDSTATPAQRAAAIRGLLEECKRAVRAWRPECRFARRLPAAAVERSGVDPASAADLDDSFAHDELAVVDAGRSARKPASPATVERLARRAVARWRGVRRPGAVPLLLMLAARDARTHAWLRAARQQAQATAALRAGLVHLGTAPVAAEGELPLGLLDSRAPAAPVKGASRRY